MPKLVDPDEVRAAVEGQIIEIGRRDFRDGKPECPFGPRSDAAGNWRRGFESERVMLNASTSRPQRPVIRYPGGKWRQAPGIIALFPPHRCYVEPFGGAGSVLLRKPRAYAEIINDLNDEIVALYRVLRDPDQASELERRLRLTPFARSEFAAAYTPSGDPIETARRLIVRAAMSFGSNGQVAKEATGFRACSTRPGSTPAHDWASYPDVIARFTARLSGVVIESRPAIQVMEAHDAPDTLHYVDPPYLTETRGERGSKLYGRFEMTAEQHEELAECLRSLPRTEVLWLNPQACNQPQPALF